MKETAKKNVSACVISLFIVIFFNSYAAVTFAFNFIDTNPELVNSLLNTSPTLCYDRVRVGTPPSTWSMSDSMYSAYISAGEGQTIEAVGMTFIEDLTFDIEKSVTVIGGYSCGFKSFPYDSVLNGSLTISAGTVIVDDIVIDGCASGFGNCEGNGCQTNIATDPDNCGGCGLVCSVANGAGSCLTGVCGVASCNSGFQDCNHLVMDGCETNTSTDPNNCGTCGNAGGAACSTSLFGICSAGTRQCQEGTLICVQNQQPQPEVCNGLDDNCDGTVDEGNPGGGAACGTGLPGICVAGTVQCQYGALVCVQNQQPQAETCDGLDNNCNGIVDEGNPGGGAACGTGLQGICAAGTVQCQNGLLVCIQNQQPQAEICDGLDNNCNGIVDEGNPGGGAACSTGLLGICAAGTRQCQNGSLICVQNQQPQQEICGDGIDNNCDGQVDEGCT